MMKLMRLLKSELVVSQLIPHMSNMKLRLVIMRMLIVPVTLIT